MSGRADDIAWWKVLAALARGRAPGQTVIQYTDVCNATCAQCGMSRVHRRTRHTLTPSAVRGLLDRLAARGTMAVSFTGGEPLLFLDEITYCIRYARDIGIPSVRTGSNGFFFQGSDKPGFLNKVARYACALAASGCTTFWISLDSADPAVHEANRGLPGMIDGLAKGLRVFHEHGLRPAVNLGLNRNIGGITPRPEAETPDQAVARYQAAFRRYFDFALELGFTAANVCYPMTRAQFETDGVVYEAAAEVDWMQFSDVELAALYDALYTTLPEYRHRMHIFTPRCALLSMMHRLRGQPGQAYPCRGGRDFFFVDAAGMQFYPCGYRGQESAPDPDTLARAAAKAGPCSRCDWECFRDPSTLFGPILEFFRNPLRLLGRICADPEWMRAWLGDLANMRACGWFDARKPFQQRQRPEGSAQRPDTPA